MRFVISQALDITWKYLMFFKLQLFPVDAWVTQIQLNKGILLSMEMHLFT